MAGSLNKVVLIGRLGADPEVRTTQHQSKVARFNLATSEQWLDKESRLKNQRTEWHRVVAFSKTAELAEAYLFKGSLVYIEGSLRTSKWTDKLGQVRYTTEILARELLFLDSNKTESPDSQQSVDDWLDDYFGSFSASSSGPDLGPDGKPYPF